MAIADGSGFAFIRHDRAREVLGVAEAIAAWERTIVCSIRAGAPLDRALDARYERLLELRGSGRVR